MKILETNENCDKKLKIFKKNWKVWQKIAYVEEKFKSVTKNWKFWRKIEMCDD